MEENSENKMDIGTIVGLIGIFLVLLISIGILGVINWNYDWMITYGILGLFLFVFSIISIGITIFPINYLFKYDMEGMIFFIIGFICIGVSVVNIVNIGTIDIGSLIDIKISLLNMSLVGIVIGSIPIIGGFLKIHSEE